ncbi:cytochrome [Sesamum angolense]|uniref:Cytochrome n=1 Tax=Sesamum angolense TaxID=2727404 RepID=A0AAE1XH21_9LAMI|nr:cytochrome [Sesamum angolense]
MDILYAVFCIITIAVLLLFILFSALVLRIFIGKSIRNLSYPPVVGTVFDQLFYFNRLYDYQTEMVKRHKTFRLLAPDQSEIYTTEPRNIEHILKTNFSNYSKGQYNQDILTDLFGQGIFIVDGEKWRQQRKLASFEFSMRVLRDFSCSVFRKNAAKLVGTIYEFSKNNQVFDIQALLMRCTLDSIFKVGFGVELNCLEGSNAEGNEFIKAFDDSNELVYWRYADPLWKLKRYLNIGGEATLIKNLKFIHNFVDKVIRTKRAQMVKEQHCNDKEDILSRFLVESKKDPGTMTDQYLRDIILNFMIAGKDTTANTLSWFIYVLCKNPLIQENVAQEVRRVIRSPQNEDSVDNFVESITDEALEEMHYLHATLTETLRLYPAVPVDGRCAETDDTLPDGFKLKKGDGVYYMAYAMGRMAYIWGDDAEEFKPERWLKNGTFQPESPFKFVAFNAGPRICLGKDFAYRQMKIVSAALVHFFSRKLQGKKKYHPIGGTVFNQLLNFHRLHDYMADLAGKYKTYRLIAPFRRTLQLRHSGDLFGDGIFAVDGHKWREQEKCQALSFLQGIFFMKSTFDSISEVAIGVELDSLGGSNEEGAKFSVATDDVSMTTLWRYVDVLWKLKRALNVGSEAKLKKSLQVVDEFAYKLIHSRTQQMNMPGNDSVMRMKKDDLLSRFLQLTDATPKYLRDITMNFIIAGKGGEEIKDATGCKEVADISEFSACLTEEALGKMHYLHAALTETLRIYPAVAVKSSNQRDGLTKTVASSTSPFKFTAFQVSRGWPSSLFGEGLCLSADEDILVYLLRFFTVKLSDERKAVKYRPMLTLAIDGGLIVRTFHRMDQKTA